MTPDQLLPYVFQDDDEMDDLMRSAFGGPPADFSWEDFECRR